VPSGVKDLFDVAGEPTTAGAAMRRNAPPATSDAEAIRRFQAAGAALVATLNIDEYAYGFATVNAAWGTTRNPHDPTRLAGGSSGGSAAAVAAGMLPFTLGSDTNGSIRVPASLCGCGGLKPTHGALPVAGVFPFVDSFDDIGPFAATHADIAAVHAVLAGAPLPGAAGAAIRAGMLHGWFVRDAAPEMAAALDGIARTLGASPVTLPLCVAIRWRSIRLPGIVSSPARRCQCRLSRLQCVSAPGSGPNA
jgi:aspartyl-tRNA(Asn)/glutamyl-tRNA(Gln) amidotransferase subunit A